MPESYSKQIREFAEPVPFTEYYVDGSVGSFNADGVLTGWKRPDVQEVVKKPYHTVKPKSFMQKVGQICRILFK